MEEKESWGEVEEFGVFGIIFYNMSMAIDWTKICKKYKGLWVALEDDEKTVISSGKTAKEAWNKAREKGHKKPILSHMPDKLIPYVGSGWLT